MVVSSWLFASDALDYYYWDGNPEYSDIVDDPHNTYNLLDKVDALLAAEGWYYRHVWYDDVNDRVLYLVANTSGYQDWKTELEKRWF